MIRLFLVEKNGPQRIDLGTYKFNTKESAISTARRRHKFLNKLETNNFEFESVRGPGPLRVEKPARPKQEQLSIV